MEKNQWFLQMLADYEGVETAKRLLSSDDLQIGFTELYLRGRLDLTVEAHVLKDKFIHLFSEEERKRAELRLLSHDPHFFQKYENEYTKLLKRGVGKR